MSSESDFFARETALEKRPIKIEAKKNAHKNRCQFSTKSCERLYSKSIFAFYLENHVPKNKYYLNSLG
ncbi:MAG: hypothetical protein IE937_00205 [Gammaproteobacteria bacterium]|jgi:hypothetical protein|nr:hypothetical protein [Gammaproteobacteria bacterium]MBD3775554.1 hypothetical protein [Thiotrichales bacterium]